MANPYDPPTCCDESTLAWPIAIPTLCQHLNWAACFSAGCVIGLNLSVALDEGVVSAMHRTTSAPVAAVSFFTCVSLFCYTAASAWKWVRGRICRKYNTTALLSFARGSMSICIWYFAALYLERSGVRSIGILLTPLFASIVIMVELEAFVVRFRHVSETGTTSYTAS